ncbi:DNA ligase 4, partial [Belonocnema kinseyi]|uniref:DNA ligase 4 n=1 Tax=Belonocnema kinseyi TaxID=2817044 RepID=UPI00143D100F
MPTLGAKIEFSILCETLEKICKFKGPNQKFDELRNFLQKCQELGRKLKNENEDTDISLYPILRLLLPEFERDRGPHHLKEKLLTCLYSRIFCLEKKTLYRRNQQKYRTEYDREDFSDRVYIAVQNQLKKNNSSLSAEGINDFLDSIANKNISTQNKDAMFLTIAKKLSPLEFKWLTKIILKDLQLGIGKKKIFEALHPNAEELFDVTSNLHEVCNRLNVCGSLEKPRIRIFFYVKPMLLERLKIEEVENLFQDPSLEYFVQIKYDGERSQIHMEDGKYKYFTRNGYDRHTYNAGFGESCTSGGFLSKSISRLLDQNCHSLILDGELMGWHKAKRNFSSQGMNFDVRSLTPGSSHQPCFVAFDLIMYNDELFVDSPYSERWDKLVRLFTEEEGVMIQAKTVRVSTSEQILAFFNKCLDNEEEGVVVKKYDGLYKLNVREQSGCYKIKAEYTDGLTQDLDLVILGANYGDGKSSGKLKSFLVGVADQPVKGGKLAKFHSVVSVSSGLNYEQLNKLQKCLMLYCQSICPKGVVGPQKNPPDIWINPENSVILQLRATEIIPSNIYPLGYSLRFPRVVA